MASLQIGVIFPDGCPIVGPKVLGGSLLIGAMLGISSVVASSGVPNKFYMEIRNVLSDIMDKDECFNEIVGDLNATETYEDIVNVFSLRELSFFSPSIPSSKYNRPAKPAK